MAVDIDSNPEIVVDINSTPDIVIELSALEITAEIDKTGPRGLPGRGVPDGGTQDQILSKVSADDGDSTWVDLDYNKAINKPMIEGVPLIGNQSFPALHLNALTNQEIEELLSV